MVHRLAEGAMEERLAEILDFDPVTPPPSAARVLGESKDALTGLSIARWLIEEDGKFVALYGGTAPAARRRFGVTSEKELVTLLLALRQLLEEQAAKLDETFETATKRVGLEDPK